MIQFMCYVNFFKCIKLQYHKLNINIILAYIQLNISFVVNKSYIL